MATIQLTGDFSEAVTTAGTEVADTRTITIRLLSTIILANNDIHSPQRWIIPLVSGAFTRYMVVPDVSAQAARYSIVLPDGPEVAFSLASTDGPIANLATILLTNLLTITPNALAVLLATYTPLATYTAHTTAIGGAALGHVKNGGNVVIDPAGLMTAAATGEPALGNPAANGYVLSSLTNGTRSWLNLAVYAQLAAAQTFTAAQTFKTDTTSEATAILKVTDNADAAIMTVKKGTGYGNSRVVIDTGNATNIPGLNVENLADGVYAQWKFSNGGSHIFTKSSTGDEDLTTNYNRVFSINGVVFTSTALPSFQHKDTGRTGTHDHHEYFPGDPLNTSKVLAVRRKTSTSDGIAGRWNVYFSDTTHATRTASAEFSLTKNASATLVVPLAYDTQDSATQTGILILHNGTQKRVKIGAADSGGAGQRLLTIDN